MSKIHAFKQLPITKLESDGSNWITYKTQLETAIIASGLGKHLNGRAKKPDAFEKLADGTWKAKGAADGVPAPEASAIEAFEDLLDEWDQNEAVLKSQIFLTIYDSLLIRVQSLASGFDIWKAVCDTEQRTVEPAIKHPLVKHKSPLSIGISIHRDGGREFMLICSLCIMHKVFWPNMLNKISLGQANIPNKDIICNTA